MSGMGFSSKGTAGAIPSTAFMPPIPSRFTLTMPRHLGGPAGAPNFSVACDAQIAANKVSLWSIVNPSRDLGSGPNSASCILGAGVTAPDGTTTATHLTEAAITSVHQMMAASDISGIKAGAFGVPIFRRLRLAVIAGAAERTRIKLNVMGVNIFGTTAGWDQTGGAGVFCIYDLAGGQIGVGPTAYNGVNSSQIANTFPIAEGAAISPVGGGYNLCILDVSFNPPGFTMDHIITTLTIDSGSGTGAESTVYLGDITKGVNVWSSSFLPVRAWAMTGNVEMVDDFTSISTVDVNDTRQPGFKWYVHGSWPWFGFRTGVTSPPSSFIQSGSVLTVKASPNPSFWSAYSISDGVWGGYTWQFPALIEYNLKVDTPHNNSFIITGESAFWTLGMFMLSHDSTLPVITGQNGVEFDFTDIIPSPLGIYAMQNWQSINDIHWSSGASYSGFQKWVSDYNYDINPPSGGASAVVGEGNTVYLSIVTNNLGNDPALTTGVDWNVKQTGVVTATITDPAQFNTYQCLLLDPTHDDPAYIIFFMNGIPTGARSGEPNMAANMIVLDPKIPEFPTLMVQDHYPLQLGMSTDAHLDFVKVTK